MVDQIFVCFTVCGASRGDHKTQSISDTYTSIRPDESLPSQLVSLMGPSLLLLEGLGIMAATYNVQMMCGLHENVADYPLTAPISPGGRWL